MSFERRHMLPADLAAVYARAVDPRFGLVRRISEIPLQPGEPPVFILAAHCTRPKYFLRNEPFHSAKTDYAVPANGVALDYADALWRVLGEACERYAAGLYRDSELITATQEELGDRAFPVERLIGFSSRQRSRRGFPHVPFDPSAVMRWTWGRNLTRGRTTLIPAALVYLGYEALSRAELFYPSISTGLAAGRTLEQALLNGLCEVVERDAFMATWLLRYPAPRIRLESLEPLLTDRERCLLDTADLEPTLVLAKTDIGLPVVLTLVRPKNRNAVVVGASAHPNMRNAAVRSLLEAYHTLNWAIHLERECQPLEPPQVESFEDHVRYYLVERRFSEISWLFEGPPVDMESATPCESDHASLLNHVVQLVRTAGYEVFYVETTTADVESLGFRTVKVIVPGLHPLNMGSDNVHEDTRRLQVIARHWGIRMPDSLNQSPHPFP